MRARPGISRGRTVRRSPAQAGPAAPGQPTGGSLAANGAGGGLAQRGDGSSAASGAGSAGGSARSDGVPSLPARRSRRLSLKNWRVRSRLLLLVVLPTLTAVILGGVSVASFVRSAVAYQRAENLAILGGKITGLIQALQTEREDTIRFITMGPPTSTSPGGGRGSPRAVAAPELGVLHLDYGVTNQLASQVRKLAGSIGSSYPPLAQQEASGAVTAIDGLGALRSASVQTQLSSLVVIQKYSTTISHLLALENEMAAGSNDAALADGVRALTLISGMKEQVSQEQAILTSALSPDLIGAGMFVPAQLTAIESAQAEQGADLSQFLLTATSAQRQLYNSALSSRQADRAQAQVQEAITLATSGTSTSANPAFTNAANGASYLVASLRTIEQGLVSSIIGRSGSLRTRAIALAAVDGLAVTLVLVLALILTTAVGRSMIRPLSRLRAGALEVAGVRLPETVRRMSEGDGSEEPLRVEPIDVASTDEIGEVARAFDQVHREAVRLASNEAALRGNVNAMFVNLSRRSQSLVERQIRLIDDLEQGEQDSERLANLFQMDHLATRMRRNSENLLVLAGHEVSRRWTQAVALVDVLRAAVSEIEQYGRVTLNVQPGISVRGQAVNDVVHLLSELVENATTFSATDMPVNVSGHLLNSGGVLLDITDQGVGMGAEEMAHANWRLDNPPVVDVAVSRRMGLFVVARLAGRHGIRVRLRPASVGGLTALVWLPDEVISHEPAASVPGPRFEPASAAGAAGVPSLGSRLAQWPPAGQSAGQSGDRSAAIEALAAARAPRFSSLPPGPDPAAPPQAGQETEVTAEAAAPETAADVTGAGAVSAEEAGAAGSSPVVEPGSVPVLGAPVAGVGVPVLGGDDTGGSLGGVVVPPVIGGGEENRLPIFESVESDWFRRGRHGADRPAVSAGVSGSWSSPGDEGWLAAEVAYAPVSSGVTVAGLPKRVPRANLVPGGVGAGEVPPPPASARSASQARDRLASFQRGVREGRALAGEGEAPDDGDGGAG